MTNGTSQQIGADGERILAQDLRLLSNNAAGQRQCICNSQVADQLPQSCNACIVRIEMQPGQQYRLPDFVAPDFFAESKNEQGLNYSGYEVDQIADFAYAAQMSGRKLWVYVRSDTRVSQRFSDLVSATGGGIVSYFRVPGYVDPIDVLAQRGLMASGFTLGIVLILEWKAHTRARTGIQIRSIHPKPPDKPKRPRDPMSKAVRITNDAEEFLKRAQERYRRELDITHSQEGPDDA